MNLHLDLFSGVGGFALAAQRTGWKTIGFSEIEPYACKILKRHWPDAPNYGDIREFISQLRLVENVGKRNTWLCEMLNRERQIYGTSQPATKKELPAGLKKSAKAAGQKLQSQKASRKEAGDSAVGNAGQNSCGANTELMQTEASGCVEAETQTGKTERQPSENNSTGKPLSINGVGEFSLEMDMLARGAKGNREKTIPCERITLPNGKTSRNCDLNLPTESPSANNAIHGYTVLKTSEINSFTFRVNLITAGVPCQPASVAGKRRGKEDYRWLWPETVEVVALLRPDWCLFENVAGFITLNGGMELDSVLSDLENIGYSVWPIVIPACAVDAKHRRDRVWIVAHANITRPQGRNGSELPERRTKRTSWESDSFVSNAGCEQWCLQQEQSSECENKTVVENDGKEESLADASCELSHGSGTARNRRTKPSNFHQWLPEPGIRRVANGIPHRSHRLKGLGNAIVPAVAEVLLRMMTQADLALSP